MSPARRGSYLPLTPDALTDRLAEYVAGQPGTVRVAIDGAPCAGPKDLAQRLLEPLRLRGRPAVHVRAENFWRDAALRLEHGHEDVEEYLNWLDAGALRREVLDPVRPAGSAAGTYLPSLRDATTNRMTRAVRQPAPPGTVLIVSGAMLYGFGLPFDVSVHLELSAASLARRTPAAEAWTLPAFERYRDEVDPARRADVVVRCDDPRRPAVRGLPG